MLYQMAPKVVELKRRLESFMDRHIYPNEESSDHGRSFRSSRS